MMRLHHEQAAWLWTVAMAICLATVTAGGAAELPGDPTLDDYLAYALESNPALRAVFHRWQAAVEKVDTADTLPDPKLSYTYFIESVETRVGPQEQKFSISQAFPWYGKLRAREDRATAEAAAAEKRFEAARLKLFYRLKRAFYEYYYLGEAIRITKENLELLEQMESVAQARYKAGGALGPVTKAQVELGKLSDSLASLKDMRRPLSARLNAAMNRPIGDVLPWPTNPPLHEVELEGEMWADRVVESNPELAALQQEVRSRASAVRLARSEFVPDLMFGVSYVDTDEALMPGTADSGKDPLMASVAINVPIWMGTYRADLRAARHEQAAVEYDYRGRIDDLQSELIMALYEHANAERQIDLYRDTLIPQAEESLLVTQQGYEAGGVEFQALIDAERVLLEFQLSSQRALANRETSLAKIEMIVGETITGDEQ
jgi:outer membrane protein TolC